jgi:uncharacterized protein with GYD domain
MATFFLTGKYSSESVKDISSGRTQKALDLIAQLGGKVVSKYVLLGDKDLVFIVDFKDMDQVIKASVGLNKLTGISFATSPAVTVEDFDRIISE